MSGVACRSSRSGADNNNSTSFCRLSINNVAKEVRQATVWLAGKKDSVEECEGVCATNNTCTSFTWLDVHNQGGYARDCYLRNDAVWQPEKAKPDSFSGCKMGAFPACSPQGVSCVFWADGTVTGEERCHQMVRQ